MLNEDFRRLNADRVNTPADFASRASDFNIEFRLACFDPNGNPTNGVVRKQTTTGTFFSNKIRSNGTFDDEAIGIKVAPTGSAPWPTNRYLNIWVCNLASLLGYATFPSDYIDFPQSDGIVVRTSAFGRTSSTQLGRTATHEIGHWLNLFHLNRRENQEPCVDDLVDDTPMQRWMHAGTTCITYPELGGRCNMADPSTMFMNYMDWVPDNCMNLFTTGQMQRSRAVFATVNGVNAVRVVQLNNYFGFGGQPTSITCTGTITVSPMCLPVTWTISGPAVIKSGNGTTKIELESNGNGTVHLTAVSGNYFAETDIQVVHGTIPTTPTITAVKTNAYGEPTTYEFTATQMQGVSYKWYRAGVLQVDEYSNTYMCYYPCRSTIPVYCKVGNSCDASLY